jgi:hypothetical protein
MAAKGFILLGADCPHPSWQNMVLEAMGGADATVTVEELLDGVVPRLTKAIDSALHPRVIALHESVTFIPKDINETRKVGSWVVVCTLGSFMSINAWLQW